MALLDFSTSPHGGQVKLLPDNASAPRTRPRLIVLHTVVGDAERTWNYFANGTNLESTFLVAGRWDRMNWPDGYIVQAMDTTREADAQYRANPFAISIETEDDGSPNDTPWTPRQLDALAWLIAECARIHDIPIRKATAWDGTGVGWHAMWGAPSPWTPVAGKECPGRARIAQIPALLERARMIASGGQEVTMDPMDHSELYRLLARGEVDGEPSPPHVQHSTSAIRGDTRALLNQVGALAARVDVLIQMVAAQSGGDNGPVPVPVPVPATLSATVTGGNLNLELTSPTGTPVGSFGPTPQDEAPEVVEPQSPPGPTSESAS